MAAAGPLFTRPCARPPDSGGAEGPIADDTPWTTFDRASWSERRADTPLPPLSEAEIAELRGLSVPLSVDEIEQVFLPLTRLLNLHFLASRALWASRQAFLGRTDRPLPFVIGLAGSVAVGKSTFARVLVTLLQRWKDHPRVGLVTTDGFLLPNAELERRAILNRKGFPESYDRAGLLRFVVALKSGEDHVRCPVYSHRSYDIVPGELLEVERSDIVLVEGLNVLQSGVGTAFVSDFFDFSVYLDAELPDLRRWYVERFRRLRDTAFRDPRSYFHRYAHLTDTEADQRALEIWSSINEKNLLENILPTRERATLVVKKGRDHAVSQVQLRRL